MREFVEGEWRVVEGDTGEVLALHGRYVDVTIVGQPDPAAEAKQAELYEQLGRVQMELAWLKKKSPATTDDKRALVEPGHPQLSVRRQCELLGLSRSAWYYEAATASAESEATAIAAPPLPDTSDNADCGATRIAYNSCLMGKSSNGELAAT